MKLVIDGKEVGLTALVEMLLEPRKLKFLMVGGLTAVLYFSLLYLFDKILLLNHNIAVTLGYGLAISFHFTCNKFMVFDNPEMRAVHGQVAKYAAMSLINYVINIIAANIGKYTMDNIYVGVLVGTAVTMILTYTLFNRWIFPGSAGGQ